MDTQTQWAIVVGFVLPMVIPIITQSHWTSQVKSIVAFALMLAAAVGTAAVQGKLNTAQLVPTMLYVMGTAIASYRALWRPIGAVDALETATDLPTKSG